MRPDHSQYCPLDEPKVKKAALSDEQLQALGIIVGGMSAGGHLGYMLSSLSRSRYRVPNTIIIGAGLGGFAAHQLALSRRRKS
jgi:NAD(P)H-dependent flavin oxidoreductase YrpB (nitropropane dioxygenase family)